MLGHSIWITSAFAALAAAAPAANVKVVQKYHTTTVCPSATAAAPLPTHTLAPALYPDIDLSDLDNLKATKGARMHYDEDPSPDTDSSMATVYADDSEYPIVQLENTYHIKDVDCSATEASIVFSDKAAFHAASEDWTSHDAFVMISYDPKCGPDHDASKRDFVLVKSTKADAATLTIKAAVEFVDFTTAFGKATVVKADLSKYTAPEHLKKRASVSKSFDFDWNEFPTNALSDSRFGSGYELFHSDQLTVQCVGCGTKGHMTLTGTFEWSWLLSVKKAEVDLVGNMQVAINVGLIAGGVSSSFPLANVQLVEIPLGAIDVPGIITIGPKVTVNAGATISVEASGDLLVGATLDWPNVNAKVDVKGGSASADGFQPTLTPREQLEGKVAATLDLHLPVSLGIGVNVLSGLWKKDLAIVDTPGFTLSGGISTEESCPIELSAGIYNNLDANILGLTTIGLASWSTDIFNTCFLGSTAAAATSALPAVTSSTVEPVLTSDTPVTAAPQSTETPLDTGSITDSVLSTAPVTSDSPATTESPVTSDAASSESSITSEASISSAPTLTSDAESASEPAAVSTSQTTSDVPQTTESSATSNGGFHQSYSSSAGFSLPLPSEGTTLPYPVNSTTPLVYSTNAPTLTTQTYQDGTTSSSSCTSKSSSKSTGYVTQPEATSSSISTYEPSTYEPSTYEPSTSASPSTYEPAPSSSSSTYEVALPTSTLVSSYVPALPSSTLVSSYVPAPPSYSTNSSYAPALPSSSSVSLYEPALPSSVSVSSYEPALPTLPSESSYEPAPLPTLPSESIYEPAPLPTLPSESIYEPAPLPSVPVSSYEPAVPSSPPVSVYEPVPPPPTSVDTYVPVVPTPLPESSYEAVPPPPPPVESSYVAAPPAPVDAPYDISPPAYVPQPLPSAPSDSYIPSQPYLPYPASGDSYSLEGNAGDAPDTSYGRGSHFDAYSLHGENAGDSYGRGVYNLGGGQKQKE